MLSYWRCGISFTLATEIRALFNTGISNEQLMLNYAEKEDSKLLSQLYEQCADDLYHFLLTQTDSVLAKDISQLTWLKVIKKNIYIGTQDGLSPGSLL